MYLFYILLLYKNVYFTNSDVDRKNKVLVNISSKQEHRIVVTTIFLFQIYNNNNNQEKWLTHLKRKELSAENAKNILNTKLRNTKQVKHLTLLKENVVMTGNKWVSVDKPNQFSIKKQRRPRRLPYVLNVKSAKVNLT